MSGADHPAPGERRRCPRRPALLTEPRPLIGYVVGVVAGYAGLIAVVAPRTGLHGAQVATFVALVACGAVCIEATRRLGMPSGVARDLLSAWWLPVALLLPPLYALLAPIPVNIALQLRVRRAPPHRRVFSCAALGLAGAAASAASAASGALAVPASGAGWPAYGPAGLWVALGCAVLFSLVNSGLVAPAARMATPRIRWREVLWDRESLLLDVVELCLGVLVTIACALTPLLLVVALPPVILLQRGLLHKQLQVAARTDAKTGLLNATAWQREADTEIARAVRVGDPLGLLIVDIDHFKQVNDTYGHLVGDRVLVEVSGALCDHVRADDVLGRFGGEEFVILLPRADMVEACRVAERLRLRVGGMAVPGDGAPVQVTISVGVAMLRTHGRDLFELLAAADLALYRAKRSGRDRVCMPSRGDTAPPWARTPLRSPGPALMGRPAQARDASGVAPPVEVAGAPRVAPPVEAKGASRVGPPVEAEVVAAEPPDAPSAA